MVSGEGMWVGERANRLGKSQGFVPPKAIMTCVLELSGPGLGDIFVDSWQTGSSKLWPWGSVTRCAERGEDEHEGHFCGPPSQPGDGGPAQCGTGILHKFSARQLTEKDFLTDLY